MSRPLIEIVYPEFCNLAGDNGNAMYLRACLPEADFLETAFGQEPAFATRAVDCVLLGGMTERQQEQAAGQLLPYAARLAELAEAGTPMLFTGNSAELLGTHIETVEGRRIACLGLFDFSTKQYVPRRFTDVFVGEFAPGEGAAMKVLGFKVQFTQMAGDNAREAFATVERGFGLAEGAAPYEGFRRQNLVATWLLGPILTTNPDFCRWFVQRVCEHAGAPAPERLAFEDTARAAYAQRLAELTVPLARGKKMDF